ncbi:hypothetical protein GC096_23810 [Paenibacillus sp. LMG 31461]|uniref:Uncharacterized protein n=1 Tax=Paenibacillus plantarum TaxID=2654975 RepID=A0ABX1XGM5_9BACL|nr:hypothetical protein [Paenibacillus plantarum]NOU67073.1 hypothetical protein [Paenibacillus plantarum]
MLPFPLLWFRYSQTGKEQYIDLEREPNELSNLIKSDDYEVEIQQWRNSLIKELFGKEERYTDGKQLLVGNRQQPV